MQRKAKSATPASETQNGPTDAKKVKFNPLPFLGFVVAALSLVSWVHIAPSSELARSVSRHALAIFFIAAGIPHFTNATFYLAIMPPFLPFPLFLVYLSGVIEIVLGVLLLLWTEQVNLISWLIIALLLAIYPANIYHATSKTAQIATRFSATATLIRLPIQFLFILWAYQHTTLPLGTTWRAFQREWLM